MRSILRSGRAEADQRGLDLVCGISGGDVLPYSEHLPAQRSQLLVRVDVSIAVSRKLPRPPIAVGAGQHAVDRTRVPETAIDEDHQTPVGERHVHASPRESSDAHLDPEPASAPVELLTK